MTDRKLKFQKLTPIDDVALDAYREALDYVFNNNDIRNVAITGSYGAGKSSVLETYIRNSKHRFLHISLAHFEKVAEEKQEDSEQNENFLEGKILNQLFHQIPSQRIPQTIFKTKSDLSNFKITIWSVLTIALLTFR
ncbi:hypothetical protein FACS1894170_02270 [Planctomycetales bacterium]|nr:hypothetical protein FACS1894170_02270 [Planctomycetales bacterium]